MHTISPSHHLRVLSVQLTTLDEVPARANGELVTIRATQYGAPWIDCVRLNGYYPTRIIVNGCLDNISISSDDVPSGHKITVRCS